jgi:hypothetical protein
MSLFPNGTAPYMEEITGLFESIFKISMRNMKYEQGISFLILEI